MKASKQATDDSSNNLILVIAGQDLVSINEESNSWEIALEAGKHTELTADGLGLIASCYGYPQVSATATGKGEKIEVCVSLIPLVDVSENKMEARLNLLPTHPALSYPDLETVLLALQQQRVNYGIDHQALENIFSKLNDDTAPDPDLLIARGKAPNHGKDAYIRFEVEIGPLPGKILADGSIDFRERLMFVGVKEGQHLATLIQATSGNPGINLTGEPLEARNGKELTVKVSEDTQFFEEDGTIRATASGVLSVVGDDTIRVSSMQKINGDVDFSTGNIRSQNCVDITGTVQTGFIVSAKGNIAIEGSIQSASINSHGNIVVKGGVIGKKSQLRVQGDADIHHIENGLVVAGGNIIIRKGAYYSSLKAGANLSCPENVKIVGGEIVAGGSLNCGQIGSPTASPMSIAIGTDLQRYRRYLDLQEEYNQLLQQTQDWYNRHGRQQQVTESVEDMETNLKEMEEEISCLNLIPGSPENSLGNEFFFYSQATLTVHEAITAGTILRIGNETMVVERDHGSCRIRMNQNSGKIVIDPL